MVLTLYNLEGKKVAPLRGAAEIHIKRVLDGGDETLDFEYPRNGVAASALINEAPVRTDRQEYIIKDVDKSTSASKIKIACSLNIDDLEGAAMPGGFETVERTLAECMDKALAGTGWQAVVDAGLTKRRTVRIEDDTTAWGVIKQALSTYRCEVRLESISKTLHFAEKRGQDRGSYFYERLGLRELGVKASSYGFYTRLIPIGKDGLRLWEDGKYYIENHQYSPKVVTAVWRDDRYTNTTSLREDAEARLAEASAPVVAYSATIAKLLEQRPEFSVSDYDLGDTVTLCSISLNTKTRQRIVQVDEYPDDPKKNTVELSNVRQTFAQLQKTADEAAKQEAIDIAGRKTESTLRENYYTKTEVNTSIQAMEESIRLEVSQTYVTVDTLGGYSTTEQMQTAISQSADSIILEVSQKYATTESLSGYTRTDEIRTRFAMDPTSITVETGEVNFKSNTITIDSDNLKVTKTGTVSATGQFKTQGSTASGGYSYVNIAGAAIEIKKRNQGEMEGEEKQCAYLGTSYGLKEGHIELHKNGNPTARLTAGTGGGLLIYDETGARSVVYANRGSDGRGYIGTYDDQGNRLFNTTSSEDGGGLQVHGRNGILGASLYAASQYGGRLDISGPLTVKLRAGASEETGAPELRMWHEGAERAHLYVDAENKSHIHADLWDGSMETTGWIYAGALVKKDQDTGQNLVTINKTSTGGGLWLYNTDGTQSGMFYAGSDGSYLNCTTIYCERLRPNSNKNTLYMDWVLVNGTDGNRYYALCGFGEPR